MTSKEFVMWMRGFMEACNDLTATPQQWDKIREELTKVDEEYVQLPNPNSSTTYAVGLSYKKQLLD